MRLCPLDKVEIGQKLGRSIYGDSGNMLLGVGMNLTKSLIEKLKENLIYYVYIDDELSKGIEAKPMIEDRILIKTVKSIQEVMETSLYENQAKGRSGVVPLKMYRKIMDTVQDLIHEIESNGDLLYTVSELMGTDMYTYRHCVNVTVLSILTAQTSGYTHEQVRNIAMGALLHDIGKIETPTELLNKNGDLNQEEMVEVMQHSANGYEVVRNDPVISSYAKQIIRLHHEKLDGSGYPLGLVGDEIPDFVQIVTIADMFDAMTSDRSYRMRMPVYKTLEVLMGEAVFRIRPKILSHFIENICIYPPGTSVKLTDGREGIVVDYRKKSPDRPIIRIIKDEKRDDIYEIDLLRELTLFINGIVE